MKGPFSGGVNHVEAVIALRDRNAADPFDLGLDESEIDPIVVGQFFGGDPLAAKVMNLIVIDRRFPPNYGLATIALKSEDKLASSLSGVGRGVTAG